MDKPKISFFAGGIRPYNWKRLYDSIKESVGVHSFELVLCGPYQPYPDMEGIKNFRYIKDYGSVSRGAQLAAKFSEGDLLTLTADDGVYIPGAMEEALNWYYKNQEFKLVLGLRYTENKTAFGDYFWKAWSHPELQLEGIPQDSYMFLNNIINKRYFDYIGGYDCKTFETANWGGHSLLNRMYNDKAKICLWDKHVLVCDWWQEKSYDHEPVHEADHAKLETSNYQTFKKMYEQPNSLIRIPFDNWRNSEIVWSKRFK